jgi:hypothetical protein
MRKYRIQEILDEYKHDGKKGKEYKQIYRKVIDVSGINPSRFYKARHWSYNSPNTLSSNDLIKISFALNLPNVDSLLNKPKEFQVAA